MYIHIINAQLTRIHLLPHFIQWGPCTDKHPPPALRVSFEKMLFIAEAKS